MQPTSPIHGLTTISGICTLFAACPAFEPVSARTLPMMLLWQFSNILCAAFFLYARAVDA